MGEHDAVLLLELNPQLGSAPAVDKCESNSNISEIYEKITAIQAGLFFCLASRSLAILTGEQDSLSRKESCLDGCNFYTYHGKTGFEIVSRTLGTQILIGK